MTKPKVSSDAKFLAALRARAIPVKTKQRSIRRHLYVPELEGVVIFNLSRQEDARLKRLAENHKISASAMILKGIPRAHD